EGEDVGRLVVGEARSAELEQHDQDQDGERQGEAQRGGGGEAHLAEYEAAEHRPTRPEGRRAERIEPRLEATMLEVGEWSLEVLREDHHVDANNGQRRRRPAP